jgi:hypothetical protein
LLQALEERGKPLIVLLLGAPYDASLVRRKDAPVIAVYTPLSVKPILGALPGADCGWRGNLKALPNCDVKF